MYKLLHWLFGWDYIYWSNFTDQGVARVFVSADGRVAYYRYKVTSLVDIIHKPEQVMWLTCHPDKYFGSKLAN